MSKRAPTLTLGDLRSLLSLEPSTDTWRLLWKRLKTVPASQLEDEFLPYILAHFAHWPDGLRVAPSESRELFYSQKAHEKNITSKRLARVALIDHLNMLDEYPGRAENELLFAAQNSLSQSLRALSFNAETLGNKKKRRTFFQAPAFAGLREVTMRMPKREKIGLTFFDDLAESTWFPSLTRLQLMGSSSHLNDIASDWWPPGLTELEIGQINNTSKTLLSSLEDASLPLTTFSLSGSANFEILPELDFLSPFGRTTLQKLEWKGIFGLGTHSLQFLARSGPYPQLEELVLSGLVTDSQAFRQLFTNQLFPNLRKLAFVGSHLGPDEAQSLAKASEMTKLEELIMPYNQIETVGLRSLLNAPQFASLKLLDLSHSIPINPFAIGELFASETLSKLEYLDISGWKIGSKAGAALGQPHALVHLKSLDTRYNQFNDATLLSIAENPCTTHLEELLFYANKCGIQTIFQVLTTPSRSDKFHKRSRRMLLNEFDKEQITGLLSDYIVPPKYAKKEELINLISEILEDDRQLLSFLCSKAFVHKINTANIKSTLRVLGEKNYTKQNRNQLVQRLINLLSKVEEQILALREENS